MTRPVAPGHRTVTSRDNPLLVRLRRLASSASAYRQLGEVWLEGEHLCSAAAERGREALTALVGESAWQRPAMRALAGHATQVVVVPDALMGSIGDLGSPPPIGFVLRWAGDSALLPAAPSVVLDRLQDAGNVGTILRSAAAFGITQVVALKGTAALWSPKVLRAGMGAHFGLHLVEGLSEQALADWPLPLLATSSHTGTALHETALPWPCGWVLGHEGQGVSPALAARCAGSVRIAQPGGGESLNVGAAAAICFYDSFRQRLAAPRGEASVDGGGVGNIAA